MKKVSTSLFNSLNVCPLDLLKTNGVYTITSKTNGKMYVGSSSGKSCFKGRWVEHISALISNTHYNCYLQNHVNKYGINDLEFNVLDCYPSQFSVSAEHYWIIMLNTVNEGFNLKYPESVMCGRNHFNYVNLDKYSNNIINSYLNDKISMGSVGKMYGVKEHVIKRILKDNNIPIIRYDSRFDYIKMYGEYLNSNESIENMAKRYGVNKTSIRNNFRSLKLVYRITNARQNIESIYLRYLNGEKLRLISKEYKIDYTSLLNIFKENNLKTKVTFKQSFSKQEVLQLYNQYLEEGTVINIAKQYSVERSTIYRLFGKYNLRMVDKRIKQ